MKKAISIAFLAAIIFQACGPNADEMKASDEQRKQDSIAEADSMQKVMDEMMNESSSDKSDTMTIE
ncbi:MAG: hypothetical protein IPO27_12160 [Bacteroidetes bacterium]|nr:hypothetical protein [Bacteroidota bacterium]